MGGVIYPLIATPCLVLSVKNQRMTPSNLWKFCWLSWWNIRPFEHQIQYVDRFAVINDASFSSSVYTSVINVKECITLDINMYSIHVYLFRRKSKNSRWITKAAWPGDLRVYISIQQAGIQFPWHISEVSAKRRPEEMMISQKQGVFYYRDQNTPQIYIRVMQYI